MREKHQTHVIYLSVIFALALLFAIYAVRTEQNYQDYKQHRQYFKQPYVEIQPWMTVSTIVERFNITEEAIFQNLSIEKTPLAYGHTLDSICKRNNLNCTDAVHQLNQLRKP